MNAPKTNDGPPELLAPAGDWECVRAAVANGADAVYFGLPKFNARMRAENFTETDLPEVVRFLHNHGVKAYVTFNVLVFTDELPDAVAQLRLLESAGVDAIIVQDVGLADLARRLTPNLRVHASTQMTITSPEGVEFATALGVKQVVLSRELSLREFAKFDPAAMPLEVFVHGALCVAYSGQCLTSESLGQRSANRGECAQACRMPYELIVDGAVQDLGDKRYLLSPQDLAAVREIPNLIELGLKSFKIEGRLKSPEYVAAVTSVYRKAIDAALAERHAEPTPEDWYRLEMTFSRGLYPGWMHGVNHQELVGARYGKKRGVFLGLVSNVGRDFIEISAPESDIQSSEASAAQILPSIESGNLKLGDGVVFDTGGDTNSEQGGRIYQLRDGRIFFEHGRIDFTRLKAGHRVWKTDDPALTRELRTTFSGRLAARDHRKQPLHFRVTGKAGASLRIEASSNDRQAVVESAQPLDSAIKQPLTTEKLAAQLGKLDETPFHLESVENLLEGEVIAPISELNRLRREAVESLLAAPARNTTTISLNEILTRIRNEPPASTEPALTVLCRSFEQLDAALAEPVDCLYVDFEDIRRYRDAVERAHAAGKTIFLATPRIQKAGEQGFFKLIESAAPDGVLIRNVGAIAYFNNSTMRKIGDFSLNVSNPVSASLFRVHGLERLTISYDLTAGQVTALTRSVPAGWLELTLHQHMPMFHMEHCVFAAFMSKGTTFLDCGRPCEKHRVHLRDRVGIEHPLRADVGCRNTLFNAAAQTGAKFFDELWSSGLRHFRVELLEENADETKKVLTAYRALIDGRDEGGALWKRLRATHQLGVTQGTY
jgi:putative protease